MKTKVKKAGGRPKGSKIGLPFTTFPEALDYVNKIWQKAQYNEMAFKDMSSFMGLHPKKAVRVLNTLKDFYGVIEKTESGYWRLTDVGKRAVRNEHTALKEIFSKNPMFAELHNTFGSKSVTEGVILDHIRKKYKGVDVEEAKRRLLEGISIIGQNKKDGYEHPNQNMSQDFILPLFQLRYALKPPSNEEIENLVEKVAIGLKGSNDDVLKFISGLMIEKKKERGELVNLLDKAMSKLNLNPERKHEKGETASDKKDKQEN